jgi:hypothetical protein
MPSCRSGHIKDLLRADVKPDAAVFEHGGDDSHERA